MKAELEAGSPIPADLAELEEQADSLPSNLLPERIPGFPMSCCLTITLVGLPGWQDSLRPAFELDSARAEFARPQKVQELARGLALETAARQKVQKASRTRAGPT
eukprot:4689455-Pyramimonas_sp.AAC.1